MALGTYQDLQTTVLNWLARPGDPLVAPAVPDMIKLFEAEANRRLRSIDAERTALLPMTTGGYSVLPSDCWGLRRVSWGGAVLQYMAPGSAPFGNTGGWSRYYTLLGVNDGGRVGESGLWTEFRLYFGPQAAASEENSAVEVVYQVGVPPLGDDRPSNWVLQNHSDAYLFGVLAEAELYIGHDERAPLWLQRRDASFASIEAFDRKTRWGGPLQVRVDAITTPAVSQGTGVPLPVVTVEAGGAVRVVNPASGTIVAMLAGEQALYVEAGPRAALTIRLPDNPVVDQQVEISFENPVTALTVTYSGGMAITGGPDSAYGPGAGLQFRYLESGWVYWK